VAWLSSERSADKQNEFEARPATSEAGFLLEASMDHAPAASDEL
jgi:hypothetical protein